MQFAVVCSSKTFDRTWLEFFAVAWAAQALEFCQTYGLDPVAVAAYSDVSQFPVDDTWFVDIVDDLNEPGASAYHSIIGNRPYAKLQAASVDEVAVEGSHEIIETLGDPTCDRWVPKGDGTEEAAEMSDPVQGDAYPYLAEVAGEGRIVQLSNYVTPPYWDRTQSGPTNKMGLPLAPFGIRPGGYQVVLGRDGNESQVFAHIRASGDGIYAAAAKRRRPDSRLSRRLEGRKAA